MRNGSTIQLVLTFAVMGLAFFGCNYLWKKTAFRKAVEWCSENGVVPDDNQSFIFMMGRPARLEFTGREQGVRYVYVLRLSAGLFNLPSTFFGVWGEAGLISKSSY